MDERKMKCHKEQNRDKYNWIYVTKNIDKMDGAVTIKRKKESR